MKISGRRRRLAAGHKVRCGWSLSQIIHQTLRKHRPRLEAAITRGNALFRRFREVGEKAR